MRRLAVGILLALILPLSACTIYDDDYGHGGYYGQPYPPPGYGDWRWDDDLRVYVNVGYPYIYYHDHVYYRWYDNHWTSGPGYRGPWRMIDHRHVPSRLGQRYYPRPQYDNRRDHDRYDYRQPRYIDRGRQDYRDYRDHRDYREQPNWQNRREIEQRRDMDRDRNDQRWDRRDQRDERYGRGDDDQQRRQLQQFRGHELDRQQQRFDVRQQQRQWQQQRHEERQVQQGMPLNRQQQFQGNDRRNEQRFDQRQREQGQRAVSQPSRHEQGGRQQSGRNQGQEQGQEQGRGAGGPQWDNRR